MSHYGYVSEQLLTGRAVAGSGRRRRAATEPVLRAVGSRWSGSGATSTSRGTGRVVTNNAATSQTPRELIELYRPAVPVVRERPPRPVGGLAADDGRRSRSPSTPSRPGSTHRAGAASRPTRTPPRRSTRSCTHCSRSSATATTWSPPLMEHNSNFVPWHALTQRGAAPPGPARGVPGGALRPRHRGAGPRPPRRARRRPHQAGRASPGASNFLGTKPPLDRVRRSPTTSGYLRPDGTTGSLLLVDAAQLAPTSVIDVAALDVDYLAFSFHKLLAPFGVGVLYARESLLRNGRCRSSTAAT